MILHKPFVQIAIMGSDLSITADTLSSRGVPANHLKRLVNSDLAAQHSSGNEILLSHMDLQKSHLLNLAVSMLYEVGKVQLHVFDRQQLLGRIEVLSRTLRVNGGTLLTIVERLPLFIRSVSAALEYLSLVRDGAATLTDLGVNFRISCANVQIGEAILGGLNELFQKELIAADVEGLSFSDYIDRVQLSHATLEYLPSRGGKNLVPRSFDAQCLVKAEFLGRKISLPAAEQVGANLPFSHVLDARRSTSSFSNVGLMVEDIGTLFGRSLVARPLEGLRPSRNHAAARLYPSGGGVYEIEALFINFVETDVPVGTYTYSPHEHSLVEVLVDDAMRRAHASDLKRLSSYSGFTSAISLVGRLDLLRPHYEEITGSLIQKNAGAIISMLYLAAASAKIDICSLGVATMPLSNRHTVGEPIPLSTILLGKSL